MNSYIYLIDADWFRRLTVGFFALVFLAILFYIGKLLRERAIAKLEYSREFSEKGVYETDHVYLIETIRNRSILPVFFVNVEAYVYNALEIDGYIRDPKKPAPMQYFTSRFHLLPFMKIRRRHLIKCAKRGYYVLETADIYYGKKVRYLSAPAEIYVYPRVVPIDKVLKPTSHLFGDSATTRRMIYDPFSFSGIRNYMSGDPFNIINFKATARSGSLGLDGIRVNKRDYCSSRNLLVYLNFQLDVDFPVPTGEYERMMELGLSYASALIREASYNGYRAGFAANCVLVTGETSIRYPIESGDLHLEAILREMAKVRPRVGISFLSLLEEDIKNVLHDTEIYILTPFETKMVDDYIRNFELLGNSVTLIKLSEEEY